MNRNLFRCCLCFVFVFCLLVAPFSVRADLGDAGFETPEEPPVSMTDLRARYEDPGIFDRLKVVSLREYSSKHSTGRLIVAVNSDVLDMIGQMGELHVYKDFITSLKAEGYTIVETVVSGMNAEKFRINLAEIYNSPGDPVDGALLIGDLPVMLWNPEESEDEGWPSNNMFMDLDGTWTANGYGIYYSHDPGSSNTTYEIWVSRMDASRLTPEGGSASLEYETGLYLNYFRKCTEFQSGSHRVPDNGLMYTHKDWPNYDYRAMIDMLYPDHRWIGDWEIYGESDYYSRILDPEHPVEYMYEQAHGGSTYQNVSHFTPKVFKNGLTDQIFPDMGNHEILSVDVDSGTDIWVGGTRGLCAHFDGTAWTRFPTGAITSQVRAVTTRDTAGGEELYITLSNGTGRIYRSLDGGYQWQNVTGNIWLGEMYCLDGVEGHVIAGGERKILYSETGDRGSWSTILSAAGYYDMYVFDLAIREVDGADPIIYAAGFTQMDSESRKIPTIFRSDDLGMSWDVDYLPSLPQHDNFQIRGMSLVQGADPSADILWCAARYQNPEEYPKGAVFQYYCSTGTVGYYVGNKERFEAIVFDTAETGYFGGLNRLYHYDNGTLTYEAKSFTELYDMAMQDGNLVVTASYLPSDNNSVTPDDLRANKEYVDVINMFTCGAGNYLKTNCIAPWYIYDENFSSGEPYHGYVCIASSTSVGVMWPNRLGAFHMFLSQGHTVGEAQKLWSEWVLDKYGVGSDEANNSYWNHIFGAPVFPVTHFIHVDHTNSGPAPDGTVGNPYPTIQAALEAVCHHDTTVRVAGDPSYMYQEDLVFPAEYHHIRVDGGYYREWEADINDYVWRRDSESYPTHVNDLSGTHPTTAVLMENIEDAVLSNLWIGSADSPARISLVNTENPESPELTIRRCVIFGNLSDMNPSLTVRGPAEIFNNVFQDCGVAFAMDAVPAGVDPVDVVFANNVIRHCGYGVQFDRDQYVPLVARNNLFDEVQIAEHDRFGSLDFDFYAGNLITDAKLDADFQPGFDSPCVNGGGVEGVISVDYPGNLPDIGVYEFDDFVYVSRFGPQKTDGSGYLFGDGTVDYPYLTIQEGVNNATSFSLVLISPDVYPLDYEGSGISMAPFKGLLGQWPLGGPYVRTLISNGTLTEPYLLHCEHADFNSVINDLRMVNTSGNGLSIITSGVMLKDLEINAESAVIADIDFAGSLDLLRLHTIFDSEGIRLDLQDDLDATVWGSLIRSTGETCNALKAFNEASPLIAHNIFVTAGTGIQLDGISGEDVAHARIHNNVFEAADTAIDVLRDAKPELIHNNVFSGCQTGLRYGKNDIFEISTTHLTNNIFIGCNRGIDGKTALHDSFYAVNYNCFYDNVQDHPGMSVNSLKNLYTDPELDQDYRLSQSSLCVDTGTDNVDGAGDPEINLFCSIAPDIGCYESPYFSVTDYYVDSENGSDITGTGSLLNPWQTIHHAMDMICGTEDEPLTIHLAPGLYKEGQVFMDPYESISGSGRENTEIYSEANWGTVVTNAGTILEDVKVTNGVHVGVRPKFDSVVRYCEIKAAGVCVYINYGDSPVLDHNIICSSPTHSGIECWSDGEITISNNTIKDNGGHGVRVADKTDVIVFNNLIIGNGKNGIIVTSGGVVAVYNNTILNNGYNGIQVEDPGHPYTWNNIIGKNFQYGMSYSGSMYPGIHDYNDVYGNSWGDYQGFKPGDYDISKDPVFVDGPAGKYYLSHRATGQPVNSPCIDAGSPDTPPFGTTRIDHRKDLNIIDMGYHYDLW